LREFSFFDFIGNSGCKLSHARLTFTGQMAFPPLFKYLSIAALLFLLGCQKQIVVDLPPIEPRTVVEGSIESGQPPIIFITKSQGFFDPVSIETLLDQFQSGADVRVTVDGVEHQLLEVCTNQLPEEFLQPIADQLGFSIAQLAELPICGYTSLDFVGEFDKTYALNITMPDGEEMSSITKINNLVSLNDLRFEASGNSDSLGFIYGTLADPDSLGNAYRWFARRVNTYPSWSENAGEVKDSRFIAPIGSVFDDVFFNGLEFEFAYFRGNEWQSQKEDDRNEELGFFKTGDTVAIKGTVIDQGVFRFVTSFESNFSSGGNPFTFPANVESNISGGAGVWAGYGVLRDTVICE